MRNGQNINNVFTVSNTDEHHIHHSHYALSRLMPFCYIQVNEYPIAGEPILTHCRKPPKYSSELRMPIGFSCIAKPALGNKIQEQSGQYPVANTLLTAESYITPTTGIKKN